MADTKSMYRIFIVEDDEIIARTVKSHLETMSDELRKSASFIQLLQMTAAYRASLRKLMMGAWSLREVTADGKSSISTLSPVSDSIRERKTERKRILCGTKSM